MANAFKTHDSAGIGTSDVTVYTHPGSGTDTVVIGIVLANVTTSQIKATVQLDAAGTHIIKDVPIPAGTSLDALPGKIVLDGTTNYNIVVSSDTASSLDCVVSVLEQT